MDAVEAMRAIRPARSSAAPPMSWTCCPGCGHQFDMACDVPKLMMLESAAKLLNVPVTRVRDLIRRKLIPDAAVMRIGQHYRIKEKEFAAWVAAGGSGLDEEAPRSKPERPADVNPTRGRGRPRTHMFPAGKTA